MTQSLVFYTKLSIRSHQIVKRILDICLSLFFLIFVFPFICLFVIPAIWLNSGSPVFFRQYRKGYRQKPFLCYKFRTMKADCNFDATVQAKREDSRVTSIGKLLRKTSVDEVPQFINVLLGNMSVVGPRPHMIEHDEMYEKVIAIYKVRFVAKPGITGWAQINGYRGETENQELMQKRVEHDIWYLRNWSLWLDIKIIMRTTVILFRTDKNAY